MNFWLYLAIFILILLFCLIVQQNWKKVIIGGYSQNKLHVKEPWLTEIAEGRKTVEGRAGPLRKFKKWIGQIVTFYSNKQSIKVKVKDVRHYDDLYKYIDGEGIDKIAPHLKSKQEVVKAYHEFYSDENIKKRGGMNGIEVEVLLNFK